MMIGNLWHSFFLKKLIKHCVQRKTTFKTIAALLTGTFVTETIFGIPGMGRYFVNSITNRDYPVIMGTVLIYAVFLVFSNLIVDLVYGVIDPRIRYD